MCWQILRFWVFGNVVPRAALGSSACFDINGIALAIGVGEVGGHGFKILQITFFTRTEEIHDFEELFDFFFPFCVGSSLELIKIFKI